MGTVVELRPVADPAPSATAPGKRITMDDGHTRIAHGLSEELMQVKYKLSGREHSVLWAVIRKTYGFMKTEDWIALSQFELMTGITKSNCIKVIRALVDRKILNRSANGNDQKLSININVSEWLQESPSKKALSSRRKAKKQIQSNSTISASDSTISASDSTPTIDKYNNNTLKTLVTTPVETTMVDQPITENHSVEVHEMVSQADQPAVENHIADQRTIVSQSDQPTDQPKTKPRKTTKAAKTQKFTPADREFAEYMMKRIGEVNELDLSKKTNLDKWADIIRLMRDQDGHSEKEIAALFHFANNHPVQYNGDRKPFSWSWVIRSPEKFRQKWDELTIQNRIAGIHHGNSHNSANGQQHNGRSDSLKDTSWAK